MSCDIHTFVLHWQRNQRFMNKITYISLKHLLKKKIILIFLRFFLNHRWATVSILIKVSIDLKFCLMEQEMIKKNASKTAKQRLAKNKNYRQQCWLLLIWLYFMYILLLTVKWKVYNDFFFFQKRSLDSEKIRSWSVFCFSIGCLCKKINKSWTVL